MKCPAGDETDYMNRYLEFTDSEGVEELLCFRYQCMKRYGGKWHLESRIVLPGYIFIDGTNMLIERNWKGNLKSRWEISIIPCEVPYLKEMCQGGSVVGISKGIIRNGRVIVTSGPLKGRESLIRKIDRHKRTAKIEIPFTDGQKQVTVGLEIYGKEI